MKLEIYGLKNCSTCQKAIKSLEAAGHELSVVDVRDPGLSDAQLKKLLQAKGDRVVNKASMTWQGMDEDARAKPPLAQLKSRPALMKRPAILSETQIWLGWTKSIQADLLT